MTVIGGAIALVLALPPGVCLAEPDPPVNELKSQAEKLGDQLEQLTEQYNGLRVRLQQAQGAARVAATNARRQEEAFEVVRERIGGLAATSYMTGGMDPTVAFLTARDPQGLLDQAATLSYFATQDSTRVQSLVQAMQAAHRARKAAEDRAAQVQGLRGQIDQQKEKVEKLYSQARDKLVKRAPEKAAELPPVSGSGKAAEALRYALTQLGKPYVWGADGPDSYDCSGLTMWAYAKVGIKLPHYTGSQWNAGTHVSRTQLQPGDLVFFYSDLHHMGMYIGAGKMLHAPQSGDVVKISQMTGRPWAGAVRVA